MSIDEISTWLDAHQLLVVSVILPITSAVFAALASWYSTRRTLKTEHAKLQFQATLKIAEFRQDWLNSLRDAMSEFQSYGVLPNLDPATKREFYELGTKIELFMNPQDENYQKLQNCMYSFLESSSGDVTDKYSRNPEFVSICQTILKKEWDRLRDDLRKELK